MGISYGPSSISPQTFSHLLSLYPQTVERVYREKLSSSSKKPKGNEADVDEKVREFLELDTWRYDVLPGEMGERKGEEKFLTKGEVEGLMGWKLKHGKYRPTLMALIRSNSEAGVEDTTRRGFTKRSDGFSSEALSILTELRGVGPATASLLLAVGGGGMDAFFGDEVWGWVCEGVYPGGEGWGKGKGGIKYTVKEYERLWEGCREVGERVGEEVGMGDVEKVGFVIGNLREGDIDVANDEKEVEDGEEDKKEVKGEEVKGEERRVLRKRKVKEETEKEVVKGKGRKKTKG